MRLVVQRVIQASVKVGDDIVGSIKRGLMVLVGIEASDTDREMEYCVAKMLNAKLWEEKDEGEEQALEAGVRVRNLGLTNPGKSWARSVMDRDFEVLLVSQFTLFGSLKKGNKPDYHAAMKSEDSKPFFSKFVEAAKAYYTPEKIQTGSFGSYMQIELLGDGPVTIIIEKEAATKSASSPARPRTLPPVKKTKTESATEVDQANN